MPVKTLLISVRPQYADKIFAGTKRVELRRTKPNVGYGDTVLVYVSSPVKQLKGTFEVLSVVKKPLDVLWLEVKDDAGVTKHEFESYYSGIDFGYAIFLRSPQSMENPVSLRELRQKWANFHPPQSYRYISAAEIGLLQT